MNFKLKFFGVLHKTRGVALCYALIALLNKIISQGKPSRLFLYRNHTYSADIAPMLVWFFKDYMVEIETGVYKQAQWNRLFILVIFKKSIIIQVGGVFFY